MSTYAYVHNNQIVEFKQIDDNLYQSWVSSGNQKKDAYRIAIYTQEPSVNANEIAEYTWQINESNVTQVWSVRNKTADELRKTWTAYEFLLRFTAQERAAFRAAAVSDPLVADFQQLAQAAQEIVSDDAMTIAGMDYLVSQNLLTQQRRDEILGSA